ncbi:hypothetical protein [Streptomyces huiliensis]|uniref:hypothetical protein n=1 Tax=Streptomyces huiliensis TaxID=2876027 RepID=UPI001CBDD661|nr:hypothetical protein [Streptomyces huiliensis]MBZ4320148.1 hypothetical protein [Streptomyces huiliensis]
MTYDIELERTEQGLTPGRSDADPGVGDVGPDIGHVDPDIGLPRLRLTGEQWAAWHRVVDRVSREFGPVGTERFPYSLMLETAGPPGRVQLDYYGDSATIEVPYRHSGPAALSVMELAYGIARVVEDETGLTGHDHEVDQPTRTGDPARAAARMSGITDWAQSHLTQHLPPVSAT